MALRSKPKHGHTSQVFLGTHENDRRLSTPILKETSATIHCSQHNYCMNTTVSNYNDNSIIESGNVSDSSDITKEILNNLRRSITSPDPPPRMKTKERNKMKKNNYVKTRFVRNNSNSSTSDEWSDMNDYDKKTVLKVKQFDSEEKEEPNTHNNSTLATYSDNESRRTSIQINGNECYSTMNVNNDTPIYLSSVVVNDGNGSSCNTYQSGTTVTISVGPSLKEVKKSKSQIYIGSMFANERNNKIDDSNTYEEYINESNKTSETFDKNDINAILGDPVEAVKRNLIPHVCGKKDSQEVNTQASDEIHRDNKELKEKRYNCVTKLFDDPKFGQLAEGLDSDLVKKLIENSLIKLKERKLVDEGSENNENILEKLIEGSIKTLKRGTTENNENIIEEDIKNSANSKNETTDKANDSPVCLENDSGCSAPYESMEYESGAIGVFSDLEPMSDCYNASASELSTEDDTNSTRSKFYQMLVDDNLCEIDNSNNMDDEHHYESIRLNSDPIYEEIGDMPPPLPINPPPNSLSIIDEDKRSGSRSIFEGASKYDILSYLVDAKERGIDDEETYITHYGNDSATSSLLKDSKEKLTDETHNSRILCSNASPLSNASDSSEDNSLIINNEASEKAAVCKKPSADIERNDSGVGSETSKSSRSRLQRKISPTNTIVDKDYPIHLCEDCDTTVDMQASDEGLYCNIIL